MRRCVGSGCFITSNAGIRFSTNLHNANKLLPAVHGVYHQPATCAILTNWLMFGTISLGDALLGWDIRPTVLRDHNGKERDLL